MNKLSIAILALLTGACIQPALAQGADDPFAPHVAETEGEKHQRRIAQAEYLIEKFRAFETNARNYHLIADATVEKAKLLKGEAQTLMKNNQTPIPGRVKMTPEQFKLASQQYNADISAFRAHAQAYGLHLTDFQKNLGECHANDAAYQEAVRKYQIHAQEFHLPNIRPPHVCGALNLETGEASHIANQFVTDQIRVIRSQQDLAKTELELNVAQQAQLGLADKAIKQSVRAEREKQLADEFGQLAEEYKLLGIEKESLTGKPLASADGSGVKHVSGTIRPKH